VTSPDTPIAAGTLCQLGPKVVRVYARIWPGRAWDERYLCPPFGERTGSMRATRDQLRVIGGGS